MTSVDDSSIPQILSRGVDLASRGDFAAALPVLSAVYQAVPGDKFPQGLSSYGLCLSKIEHKNKLGAELCEKAIALQPYEGLHWSNLVRLYIGVKNRKRAVEVLDKGLQKHPKDGKLLRVREEIGYRKTPYLKFIRRTHPLNKFYSRTAGSLKKNTRTLLVVIGALIGVIAIVGLYLSIVK